MLKHGSAIAREQSPHANETTKTAINLNALKRRAQVIVNDKSIDAETRAIIRYGLEINDPWLAELVRRVDTGESIAGMFDSSPTPIAVEGISDEEKIEALAELICCANDKSAAALLVLMRTLEISPHAKLLANKMKHFAFTYCSELDLYGMVDAQIAVIECELWDS